MKRKTLGLYGIVLIVIFTSSCSNWTSQERSPAYLVAGGELIEKSKSIIDKIAKREINSQSCAVEIEELISTYSKVPATLQMEEVKTEGQEILDQSFKARMALHSMITDFPNACRQKLKILFLKMRMVEDFVGVHFYEDQQLKAESIKFSVEPVPVYEGDKYHPYQLGEGINQNGKFEFKNGDIMITKGVSIISSTISEIATPKSVFSHIVFVHVDEETKKVETIESYVGKGVSLFTIEDALKNENARILVLRAKDHKLASAAANHMYEKVKKFAANKKVIPYDYNIDFSDNSKLSCEEVAFDGFKTMSKGQFLIPDTESEVLLDDAKFLKRIGIRKGPMMVPTDIETDPRFEVVLDWTDYRIMRDSWRKDAVLGEMLRWIQEHNYKIHENFTSIAAKVVWSTRYSPGLWPIMSKLSGIPKDFMKDIPNITISTMASLREIGGLLMPIVAEADEAKFKASGKWMTTEELRKVLDDYRQTNPKKLRMIFRD